MNWPNPSAPVVGVPEHPMLTDENAARAVQASAAAAIAGQTLLTPGVTGFDCSPPPFAFLHVGFAFGGRCS